MCASRLKDSNTDKIKKSRGPKTQFWDFTFNNWDTSAECDIKKILMMNHYEQAIFGREVGESGTPHLQGMLKLVKRQHKSWLLNSPLNKDMLENKISFRPARNIEALTRYVQKENDHVWNKQEEIKKALEEEEKQRMEEEKRMIEELEQQQRELSKQQLIDLEKQLIEKYGEGYDDDGYEDEEDEEISEREEDKQRAVWLHYNYLGYDGLTPSQREMKLLFKWWDQEHDRLARASSPTPDKKSESILSEDSIYVDGGNDGSIDEIRPIRTEPQGSTYRPVEALVEYYQILLDTIRERQRLDGCKDRTWKDYIEFSYHDNQYEH